MVVVPATIVPVSPPRFPNVQVMLSVVVRVAAVKRLLPPLRVSVRSARSNPVTGSLKTIVIAADRRGPRVGRHVHDVRRSSGGVDGHAQARAESRLIAGPSTAVTW